MTDYDLISRCALRDTTALEQLYDRHGSRAFGHAINRGCSHPQAEDVVERVFMTIWRRARHFTPARVATDSWFLPLVQIECERILRQPSPIALDPPDDPHQATGD